MFFQGSLEEGINTALQEAKLVVCFVTDGESESQIWENDFLTDESLKPHLESQAVALRLQAGSQEAGFLEALFPVPRKPTVVVIQNSQLKEYIAAGTSKEEFLRRARTALGASSSQNEPRQQAAADDVIASTSAGQTLQDSQAVVAAAAAAAAAATAENEDSASSPPAPAQSTQNARLQAILAERAKRLEADKKAKDAAAKAEAEARAKARREIEESSSTSSPSSSSQNQNQNLKPAERKYADELRHRKQQAAEERRRILRRIEDDRRERKEREAQERQARLLAQAQSDDGSYSHSRSRSIDETATIPLRNLGSDAQKPSQQQHQHQHKQHKQHEHCNLQIRLFTGSTIRARFPSAATLLADVRPWIDARRRRGDLEDDGGGGGGGGGAPYTFRVVLTPLPNRAIAAAEESETLAALGLAPSATLVLVPVPRFADAYARSGNPVWRGLASFWGLFAGVWGLFVGLLFGGGAARGGRGGGGGARQRQRGDGEGEDIELDDLTPATDAAGRGGRIRGFDNAEDRKRRDAQLYNGNSLNFEPRRDDDDDDDDDDADADGR